MAFFEDPTSEDDLMMGRRRPRAPAAPVNPTPTNPLIRTPPFLPPTRPIAQTTPYPLPIPRQPTQTDETGMEMPARAPGPQMPQGIPGGSFPSGPIAPTAAAGPSNRAQEFGMAQMASQNATPQGFKGRLLSGLRAGLAGRGFISGFADPRGEQQAQFYGREAPQMAQRWQLEDQELATQAAAAQRALDERYKNAQIGEIESQNKAREAAGKRAQEEADYERTKPIQVAPDASLYDPRTKQPIFTAPPRTREAKDPSAFDVKAEQDRVTEEWGDPRAVATSSTKNRRESIIDTLPAEYQTILRTGKTPAGDPAGPGSTKRRLAEEAFNKAEQQDIEQGTRLDTQKREAEARRRLSQRPSGPQAPARPQPQGPAPLPVAVGHLGGEAPTRAPAAPTKRLNINNARQRYGDVDFSY